MFGCTKCGACCRKIDIAVQNTWMMEGFGVNIKELSFPYKWDEQGTCEKLIDNKCSVYNDRPLLCRIDKIIELIGVDKEEFYSLTKASCNGLMKAEGIYEEYKIL